jgi:dihydroorotate dehydrogenase (NAD+) catalytic subunit
MTTATLPGIQVFGTTFQNPVLLSAGTAGFGREIAGVIRLDRLGGIVTKAVSPEPRQGHPGPRVGEFDGGMVNAVGLANPGLDRVCAEELPWLASHVGPARVLVNVVGARIDDFVEDVQRPAIHPVVSAVALNVSCPNTEQGGREFCGDAETLSSLVAACREATVGPMIVKLGPHLSDLEGMAEVAAAAGADGFTLVNTLPSARFEAAAGASARLGFGSGGVSGPPLLSLGVAAVERVRTKVDLPVIGVGGIRSYADARRYLDAGASLVAVGTAALADPRVPERIAREWQTHG